MARFEPHPTRRPAIVAGASSGIGAATATALAARGFPVALGARRVEKCQELVDQIKAEGGEAIALPLDVTDGPGIDRLGLALYERVGRLDILLGNAGVLGTLSPMWLSLSLSFAAGAMFYVVFGELLPEAILMWRSKLPAFATVVGVLVGLILIYI